jgi:KDO2-lipid IV(A) lauroyltransferase
VLYFGYCLARIVASVLPVRVSYWIAERVADVWYMVSPSTRADLRYNLALVPGVGQDPSTIRETSQRMMRNFARMVTEFVYFPRINMKNLPKLADLDSFRPLKEFVSGGPAMLLTAHMGNWELAGAIASMMGIDLHVVVLDHPDKRVARMFRQRRQAKGVKAIPLDAPRQLLRCLKRGACVGIVGDRDFRGSGAGTHLFGIPVTVPSAYAALGARDGIPIIPGFCLRDTDGRYRLLLGEPLLKRGDTSRSPGEIVEAYVRTLENCVEKHVTQWYFFQRVGEKGRPYV